MIIQEYKFYFDILISITEEYIEKNGVLRGIPEKAVKQEIDYNYIIDYRFFVLSKSLKTLKAYYSLLEDGFYEDALVLCRTMYECYLSNRYFEDQFDLKIQNDMLLVPMGLMIGKLAEGEDSVTRRETGETIDYTQHGPQSLIMGKDKAAFYPLYSFLCTLAHCNFSQCLNYLEPDLHFTLNNNQNADISHIIGLYIFSKLYESTVFVEGMPFESSEEAKAHEDFLVSLTSFLYLKLNDTKEFNFPKFFSEDMMKKIFKYMKNSYKEQLGTIDKSFVAKLEKQKLLADKKGITLRESLEADLKAALISKKKPSDFFINLKSTDQLRMWYPELNALIGLEQDKTHHPEGDVWTHTMEVIDRGAAYRDKTSNPYAFMLLCLTHDFGKIVSTELINDRIHSYGHETKGLPLIEKFLRRITKDEDAIQYVFNMVPLHMKPGTEAFSKSAVKTTNRMFDEAAAPEDLIYMALSDKPSFVGENETSEVSDFLFERLNTFKEMMERPYVTKQDLLDEGFADDDSLKEALDYAHKLRLAGIEKEKALKQTISFLRNHSGGWN